MLDALPEDRPLSASEIAELLSVTTAAVGYWVRQGRVRAFRTPGGNIRITPEDLVEFLEDSNTNIPHLLEPYARPRILIVDDDALLLRSYQRSYKKETGAYFFYADNGVEALVQVGEVHPHVVVLDVRMPELDGIEACRLLQARKGYKPLVIVATAHATPTVEARAKAAGACAFVEKPIRPKQLLQLCVQSVEQHALSKSRAFRCPRGPAAR